MIHSRNQREKFWFQVYLLFCFVKDLNSDELFSCSKEKENSKDFSELIFKSSRHLALVLIASHKVAQKPR
jgi:hypothetical protein